MKCLLVVVATDLYTKKNNKQKAFAQTDAEVGERAEIGMIKCFPGLSQIQECTSSEAIVGTCDYHCHNTPLTRRLPGRGCGQLAQRPVGAAEAVPLHLRC